MNLRLITSVSAVVIAGSVSQACAATTAAPAANPTSGRVSFPGDQTFHSSRVTAAQVRTTVRPSFAIGKRLCYRPEKGDPNQFWIICNHGIPRGYRRAAPGPRTLLIDLRFTARVAANNRHSVYEFSLGRATGPKCQGPANVSGTTMNRIHVSEHVVIQDFESPCPGTYRGLITYQPNGGPGRDALNWERPIRDHSKLVGRFRFVVR